MLLAMLCPNSKINSSWSFQAPGKCCAVVRVATLWLCNQMWQFYLILPGLAKMKIHDHQDQTQTERCIFDQTARVVCTLCGVADFT